MNAIILPSQQANNNDTYQEVINDLGCGYSEKYTLVNGKKHGLYEYKNGIYTYERVSFVHGVCHGTKIKYYGMGADINSICEKTEFANDKLHGYSISYNITGMPTCIMLNQNGEYAGVYIIFNNDGSINYNDSEIPTNYNISEIINYAFKDINSNDCMEKYNIIQNY